MAITNYVHENIAGTGLKWHPVTDEGDVLYYPCGENLEVGVLFSHFAKFVLFLCQICVSFDKFVSDFAKFVLFSRKKGFLIDATASHF